MRNSKPIGWLLALALVACGEGGPAGDPGLVFVRRAEGGGDLFHVRLSDGRVRPLLETTGRDEVWPYWSAAAGQVVFQGRPDAAPGGDRLFLLDPVSGRVEPLSASRARRQHWPVWMPDGSGVVFAFVDSARGSLGLARVSVPSRSVETLASGARYYRPEVSPDGRLVLVQRAQRRQGSRLWLLEDGARPRPLVAGGDGFEQKGRFTRDGEAVVFTRRDARGKPGDLVWIRTDGSRAYRVASTPESDDHTASPSPTRDELVFVSDRDGASDIFLAPLPDGPVRPLTRTPELEESAPHWSPDGERLVLTVRSADWESGPRPLETRIVVIDREGRVELDVEGLMPDWMPDP